MPPEYPKRSNSQEKSSFFSDSEKDRIKREADFLALARSLGVENIRPGKNGQYTGNSIFVDDDKRHLSFNVERNVFQCFKSGESGDIFKFVMLARRCSFHEAVCFVKEFHNEVGESQVEETSKEVRKEVKATLEENVPLNFELKGLFREHPYFQEKGITPEMVEFFGLGWQKAGSMGGRIVYPLHDEKGRLVAYAGRAIKKRQIEEEGKYKFPPGFHKSLMVYNWHRVQVDIQAQAQVKEHGIIVVEGFNDVVKLWQNGYRNVVALMGNTMSARQQELIIRLSNRVILFLDNNAGGRAGIKKILNRPEDGGVNGLAYLPGCFIRLVSYHSENTEPEELS